MLLRRHKKISIDTKEEKIVTQSKEVEETKTNKNKSTKK